MKDAAAADSTYQNLRLVDLFLRLAVLPFSVASIWIMVKNNQSIESYGKVEFNNLTGLKRQLKIDAQKQLISQIPESLKENLIECLRSFSQGTKRLLDD